MTQQVIPVLRTLKHILASGLLLFSASSFATLISGDFRTESDIPGKRNGALIYESLNQTIGKGYELDSQHFVENPSGWSGGEVWMDYNPDSNLLTLNSQDGMDFSTFDAWISDIIFDTANEMITGVSLVSNNLVTPTLVPALSFTDSSLHINYTRNEFFNFTGGSATFQIQTGQVFAAPVNIPAPSSVVLIALGMAGLVLMQRQQSRS